MKSIRLILVTAAIALVQAELQAATITVGRSCLPCPLLQAALAITNTNAQDDEVRLANNMVFDHISITKTDTDTLAIRGGYPNCASANPLGPPTVLDGSGGPRSVIEASAGALVLVNLQIEGAVLPGEDSTGGESMSFKRRPGWS
jgi:hypothetical protein